MVSAPPRDAIAPPDPWLYTAREAASILRMSLAKVYVLMQTGELPSLKIGGNRRIESAALREYIAKFRDVSQS